MRAVDPKTLAQERFAKPETRGIDIIGRCATDPPLVVRGLLDAVRERAGPGSRVVELGFGSGWLLEELRTQTKGISLFGLDMSAGYARRAHELYGDRVRILIGDMERLPFRDESFDVIVACWTLYFMRDIDAALAEIRRCLAPRGRLVVGASDPDHEIECDALALQAARIALGRELEQPDIGARFDLETGADYLERQFARVEVRRWPGEMVLSDLEDVLAPWPKWQPAGLDPAETERARATFARLASERIERDGSLWARRRDGAFVCEVE